MRHLLLLLYFNSIALIAKTQSAETIIMELKTINQSITQKDCAINTAAISNRAMNIFLADKTGYLSANTDLSFYTNYVTLQSAEARITINHNFQKTNGVDEPIRQLFSVGASATVPYQFAIGFLDKSFESELGITLNYKWLGKVKTRFSGCGGIKTNPNQKQQMDALRTGILHRLEIEIVEKEMEHQKILNAIDNTEIAGQNIDSAKAIISRNFYQNLKTTYEEKFARLQAETLTNTNNIKSITTSFTGINIYLPVLLPKYSVASSFNANFQNKHPCPLAVTLSHTRLWENSRAGRLFITISGNLLLNNSKLSYGLDRINYTDYKNAGGTDTSHANELKSNKAYFGNYQTFITPSINARIVYFPVNSHIGIAASLEKSFGNYHALNGKLSIPIVLINSKNIPAVNFNFDVLFLDVDNRFNQLEKAGGKVLLGISVGIPFSRLMF